MTAPRPGDILILQNTIWLSQSYVLNVCPEITEPRLRRERSEYKSKVPPSLKERDILPDTKKAWRWGFINGFFYYAYNNIPNKSPQNYWGKFPGSQALRQLAAACQAEQQTTPLEDYLTSYIDRQAPAYLTSYNDCTLTQQRHLSRAAALCEGVLTYIFTANINTKKYAFFEQIASYVKKHEIKYFPENPRVIKRKLEAFFCHADNDGCHAEEQPVPIHRESISGNNGTSICHAEERSISGNDGTSPSITSLICLPRKNNQNAVGDFNDDEIRAWVLQLRHDGRNLTNAYIIRKIQQICTLTCKPCPKDRWIGNIMEEHNTRFLTAIARFGAKGRNSAMYQGYQPFKNALHAGDCWQVDGSRFNLIEARLDSSRAGAEAPKKAYLYIVAVRDVHSGMILGYDFCVNESHYAVTRALQMAAETAGYLPYELVCDKFPGHNTPGMIAMLNDLQQWGMKLTFSSDPNSKAQMERWFGTLQTVFMQDSRMYYGQGIMSTRPYAHRSPEYLAKMRREAKAEGWDWDAAIREATQIITNYNATAYSAWSRKHKTIQESPEKLHKISEKPYAIPLQQQDYSFLFGIKKPLKHKLGLIETQINNLTYYFWITDYSIISTHATVLCCFDYNDLSSCELYASNCHAEVRSNSTCHAEERSISQYLGRALQGDAAQPYGPNANWDLINKRKALIKETKQLAEAEYLQKTGTYDGEDTVTLLAPMTVNKPTYEAAETIYLAPSYHAQEQSNPSCHAEERSIPICHAEERSTSDDDFIFNPRNNY